MTDNKHPTDEILRQLLQRERPLPKDAVQEQIVIWRTFRDVPQALRFSQTIMLGEGQRIVGGRTTDSVGQLYWFGVHVDDLAKWGNTKAIQMTDAFDGESPEIQGRPFEKQG